MMTKYDLEILATLINNSADASSRALSATQIMAMMDKQHQKSYSTLYRHLGSMAEKGYIQYGLIDGLASTYLISETGKMFYNAHN